MPLSSAKRAWIVIAVLACAMCAIAAFLAVHNRHDGELVSGASKGAYPDLLNKLPPDAPSLGYADLDALRSLKDSPLAAFLGLTSSGPQADLDYKEFVRNTGFDYTRDLDKVAVAYWPAALGSSSGQAVNDSRLLAVAIGRFNEPKIKAYALRTGKTVQQGAHLIYEVPGDPVVAFEFLSPTQIALTSGNNSESLLWAPITSPIDSGMKASVNRVAGAPVFAVMRTDHLPPDFYSNFHNSPQLVHLVRSIKSLTLAGEPEGENIEMALDGECASMADAASIATLIDGFRMFGSMAFTDPKARSQMTKEQAAFLQSVMNQVKVSHQDAWVRLGLTVTPEMLGVRPPSQSK